MLNQVHDHIVNELGHSSRTDTIFVITAIVFNLVVLGINSAVAGSAADARNSTAPDLILAVFVLMTLLVNVIAVTALYIGRRTRRRLLEGLISMYSDNDVDKYYNPSLLSDYGSRYILFAGVIILLAVTSIVVPLIVRFI
ncbi:MAG TPA: hypothetical protein VJK02_05955 [Anaerolineales bacterium]|jgi:hypothetical protein|nr:hypothetical protein [Anaerolineales bacterium]